MVCIDNINNLFLYLVEKVINRIELKEPITIIDKAFAYNSEENIEATDNHDEFRYKLQIMEQQITEIDEFLQEENDNDINYDEYLS